MLSATENILTLRPVLLFLTIIQLSGFETFLVNDDDFQKTGSCIIMSVTAIFLFTSAV